MSEKEKDEPISTKKFFIKYGICTGFLAVILVIVIYTVRIAHNTWNNNLKVSVESCLEDRQPGLWSVGSFVEIKNPYSSSAACYETRNRETGELYYSVISRIMTYYGPVNCVFICSKDGEVSIVGTSAIHGRIWEQIKDSRGSVKIKYFSERIPIIIGLNQGGKQ